MNKILKSISFCLMVAVLLLGLVACTERLLPTVNPVVADGPYYVEDNALPEIALSANDTDGTIAWDAGQEVVLGESEYNWTFTPTDTYAFKKTTGKISLTFVNKSDCQVVDLPTAGAISYGQSLSDSTLSGGSAEFEGEEVDGTFAWQTPTTVPTVADSNVTEYSVTFTPDDNSFDICIVKVKLTVNKAVVKVLGNSQKVLEKYYDGTTAFDTNNVDNTCFQTTFSTSARTNVVVESCNFNDSTISGAIKANITFSLQDSLNFELQGKNTCELVATIKPAKVTVAFLSGFEIITKAYDGTTDVLTVLEKDAHYSVTCNTSAVPTLTNLSYAYSSAAASLPQSGSTIVLSFDLSDEDNFVFDSSCDGTISTDNGKIEKATLTVSAKAAASLTKKYDASAAFAISSVHEQYQIACNTAASDIPTVNVTSVVADSATVNATKSVVSISIVSDNYKLAGNTFEIPTTITPATLSIAVADGYGIIYKNYDGTTGLGNGRIVLNEHYTLSSDTSAVPTAQNVSITCAFNSANVADANTITAGFVVNDGNYTLDDENDTLIFTNAQIRKDRIIVVKAADKVVTKGYDGSNSAVVGEDYYTVKSCNYDSVLPNNLVAVSGATYSSANAGTDRKVTATFAIAAQYLANYEWDAQSLNTCELDGKILPINIVATSVTQSALIVYTTGSAISLVAENFILPENTAFVSATCQTDIVNAGNYTVTVKVNANANYSINGAESYSFAGVSVVVTQAVPEESSFGAVINHENAQKADLLSLNASQISSIKNDLKIAYFHTSHGNQIIEGNYAVNYMFGNDRAMDYSNAIVYDSYGAGLYVDAGQKNSAIEDMGDDIGSLVTATKSFFGDAGQNGDLLFEAGKSLDVNVVIWSWCGELSVLSEERVQQYLDDLNELENYYNGVNNPRKIVFVYMTGHLYNSAYYPHRTDDTKETNTRNNALIRNYCIDNNKILFDFEDIESYDPDGVYYGDRCNDASLYWNGAVAEWWARDWQNGKTENVDWVSLDTVRNSTPAPSFEGFRPLTSFSHVEYSIIVLSKAYAFWGLLNHLTTVV